MHDGAVQYLVAAKMLLENQLAAAAQNPDGNPDSAASLVEERRHLLALITAGLEEARLILDRMQPPPLSRLGLGGALRWLVERFAWQLQLHVRCDDDADRLPESTRVELYRICQTALGNIVAHARAAQADIDLSVGADGVTLWIRDDGQGMSATSTASGRGWASVQRRAARLGGRVELQSSPGAGTRLRVWLPPGRGSTPAPRNP